MVVQAMRSVFVADGAANRAWSAGPVVPVRPRSGAVWGPGAGWTLLEPGALGEPVVCQFDVTVAALSGEADVLWLEGGELHVVRCARFQRVYVRRGVPHCVHNPGADVAAVLRSRADGGDCGTGVDGEPRREWTTAFTAAVAAGLAG